MQILKENGRRTQVWSAAWVVQQAGTAARDTPIQQPDAKSPNSAHGDVAMALSLSLSIMANMPPSTKQKLFAASQVPGSFTARKELPVAGFVT